MTNQNQEQLDKLRHSAAHLLAASVLELYPGTKNAIGPASGCTGINRVIDTKRAILKKEINISKCPFPIGFEEDTMAKK